METVFIKSDVESTSDLAWVEAAYGYGLVNGILTKIF